MIDVPEIWTRSATFARLHRVDVYAKASFVLRDLTPGAFTVEGIPPTVFDADGEAVANPAYSDLVEGAGLLVFYGSGAERAVLMSGPVEEIDETQQVNDDGVVVFSKKVSGSSDLALLGDREAHPSPVDLDTSTAATKTYTGVGETVLKALLNDNLGATAHTTRKLANFSTATDQARGTSITDVVRFDPLRDLVTGWCIRAGIFPTAFPTAGVLVFDVRAGVDRHASAGLTFGIGRSNASLVRRVRRAPEITYEWVGGTGVGAARTFRTAEDAATAALWGRRREGFRDRRDTVSSAALDQQGAEDLLARAAQTIIAVEALDAGQIRYGVDYLLGDTVGVEVPGGDVVRKVVREVQVDCTPDDVTRVRPQIGDPLTPGVDDLFVFQRVRNLEWDAADLASGT